MPTSDIVRDPEARRRVHDRLAALAEEVDLPFDPPGHVPSSRLALELAEGVRRQRPDAFDALHRRIFRAHWSESMDIGDPSVLLELAEAAGVDGNEARSILSGRTMRDEVDASTTLALETGVTGTPAWLIGSLLVPGCQPRETFDRLIPRIRAASGP